MPTAEQTRVAREREAMARAPRQHMEPEDRSVDVGSIGDGVEKAEFMESAIPPQWIIAWKLFLDEEGEYGIPYPVPHGQMFTGANALINMRRSDGGFHWTTVEPARLQKVGLLECIEETCGDAHIGGKRKRLHSIPNMIEHVESFHPRAAKVYAKYLDQLADRHAMDNPRLQALLDSTAGGTGTDEQLAALAERKKRRESE